MKWPGKNLRKLKETVLLPISYTKQSNCSIFHTTSYNEGHVIISRTLL